MSRQSKSARNLARARDFSALRKSGGSGPKSTKSQHGKNPSRKEWSTLQRGTGGPDFRKWSTRESTT